MMRAMRGFVGGLAIISAAALVACTGSSTSAAHTKAAGRGMELPASQIPWNQVAPGWILAAWSLAPGLNPGQTPPAGQPSVAPLTLYLLDPAGGRYTISTIPLLPSVGPGDPGHTPMLVDWSGDGKHALLEDYGVAPNGQGHTTITEVDLATGAKQTFAVATQGVRAAYSRPSGQSILLSNFGGSKRGWTLDRVDPGGKKQLTFPTDLGTAGKFNGSYLESSDGTQLVLGTGHGLVVIGDDGVVARQLPPPGPLADCSPIRWWTATVILARCDAPSPSPGSQLWQVSVDGKAPAALTAVNTGQEDSGFGNDLGDVDAWQLPSGTFLQSEAGCGVGFLSRLTPDMHTTPVSVPGVDNGRGVRVTGAAADKLVLEAKMGCGSGISLLTFDPAANTSSVLLGPPVNGGGVRNAILYPTP
jgi:hypothetical protein